MVLKEALRFVLPLLVGMIAFFAAGWTVAGVVALGFVLFVCWFFRSPERDVPDDPRIIVSPADGKVVRIDRVGEMTRIAIFLSILDVHVNRSPIAGTVEAVQYTPGRFLAAFNHRASTENERNLIMVRQGDVRLTFTQIAGVVARRIVCWKKAGDRVLKGELVGLIRFGSRVEITLPVSATPTVAVGDRVRGGSSPIGRFR